MLWYILGGEVYRFWDWLYLLSRDPLGFWINKALIDCFVSSLFFKFFWLNFLFVRLLVAYFFINWLLLNFWFDWLWFNIWFYILVEVDWLCFSFRLILILFLKRLKFVWNLGHCFLDFSIFGFLLLSGISLSRILNSNSYGRFLNFNLILQIVLNFLKLLSLLLELFSFGHQFFYFSFLLSFNLETQQLVIDLLWILNLLLQELKVFHLLLLKYFLPFLTLIKFSLNLLESFTLTLKFFIHFLNWVNYIKILVFNHPLNWLYLLKFGIDLLQ